MQKLIVRHPHVFGDAVANNTKEALDSWDSVKASLKGTKTASSKMDSIALELPALMRAQRFNQRQAKLALIGKVKTVLFQNLMKRLTS